MKKFISLMLILALCLCLAACESKEEKAQKQALADANALMESGDYAAAKEAYAALGDYEDAAGKVQEADQKIDEQEYGQYYGTWVNLYDDQRMTLEAMGMGTLDGTDCTYAIDGATLTLSGLEREISLEITDHNGTPRLVNREMSLDLVPEAEVEAFAPVTVDITMDNWEEYFVLREDPSFGYVDLPCPETGVPDFELWMKPEYVYKLLDVPTNDMMELDVVFTFAYEAGAYEYKVNTAGEYTFTFLDKVPSQYTGMIPEPRECTLQDYRPMGMILNETQCPVAVWGGWTTSRKGPNSGIVLFPTNPSVASVRGTITLLP